MYDIWQNLDFEQVGMDLNNVIYAWHLAMYLIKRKLYSTKSTKKNTQPNIVRLQYSPKQERGIIEKSGGGGGGSQDSFLSLYMNGKRIDLLLRSPLL